jgi:hypothetical protein
VMQDRIDQTGSKSLQIDPIPFPQFSRPFESYSTLLLTPRSTFQTDHESRPSHIPPQGPPHLPPYHSQAHGYPSTSIASKFIRQPLEEPVQLDQADYETAVILCNLSGRNGFSHNSTHQGWGGRGGNSRDGYSEDEEVSSEV